MAQWLMATGRSTDVKVGCRGDPKSLLPIGLQVRCCTLPTTSQKKKMFLRVEQAYRNTIETVGLSHSGPSQLLLLNRASGFGLGSRLSVPTPQALRPNPHERICNRP